MRKKYYPNSPVPGISLRKSSLRDLYNKREEYQEELDLLKIIHEYPTNANSIKKEGERCRAMVDMFSRMIDDLLPKMSEAQKKTGFIDTIFRFGKYDKIYKGLKEKYDLAVSKRAYWKSQMDEVMAPIYKYNGEDFSIRKYERYIELLDEAIYGKTNTAERKYRTSSRLAETTYEVRGLADRLKKDIFKNTYCPYCGKELDYMSSDIHLDHIKPISKGGYSSPRNLVYVCAKCNLKKGSLLLKDFIQKYDLNKTFIDENLTELDKTFEID